MFKKLLTLFIASFFILAGCDRSDQGNPDIEDIKNGNSPKIETETEKQKPAQTAKEAAIFEIDSKKSKGFEIEAAEFDIADKEYIATSGKKMPYKLRGVMAVPKGEGPYPLVIIVHGSHSNLDMDARFDTGFLYLAEKLAENGYIALSLDVSRAYHWKYGDVDDKEKVMYMTDEHIKSLLEANNGAELGYPINISGKIDFSNIALIGHSRGGDTIFDIAMEQEKKGKPVKALLSIAPTAPYDIETRQWPASDVSIIVPEYDGDVVSLDGFMIDSMLDEKSDRFHTLTYLYRANHNYFNTNININDASMIRKEEQLFDQITPEQQQEFLVNYALDFFNAALLQETEGSMYESNNVQADKMYGLNVLTRMRDGNSVELVDIEELRYFHAYGATRTAVTDSWFYQDDNVAVDTITFGNQEYKVKQLLNIKWKAPEDKLTISPQVQDFSAYNALTWNLIPDSSDLLYADGKSTGFRVELKDNTGRTAQVIVPAKFNSLRVTAGIMDFTEIDNKKYYFWLPITPVGNTRLPLNLFSGIDLKHIEEVTIYFDQSESGSMYLESILLQ